MSTEQESSPLDDGQTNKAPTPLPRPLAKALRFLGLVIVGSAVLVSVEAYRDWSAKGKIAKQLREATPWITRENSRKLIAAMFPEFGPPKVRDPAEPYRRMREIIDLGYALLSDGEQAAVDGLLYIPDWSECLTAGDADKFSRLRERAERGEAILSTDAMEADRIQRKLFSCLPRELQQRYAFLTNKMIELGVNAKQNANASSSHR